MEAQITVCIVSWLLEDKLVKTLSHLPRTTHIPLNLCLHVQGEEQLTPAKRQAILDASSGFMERDIYFTKGNQGIAPMRSAQLQRKITTPYIYITDNDMIFQEGSLDAQYAFLNDPANSAYVLVDLVHNYLKWHRKVVDKKVICFPVDFETQHIVDVDMIGGASNLIRTNIAKLPNIIDPNYFIGTWDFDMALNIRKLGWKVATLVDKRFIAINDKTERTAEYLHGKVANPIRAKGRRYFERKWGFSSETYPMVPAKPFQPTSDTLIISRAIYTTVGDQPNFGVIDEERLDLMQRYFINSLRNQSDMDFVLLLIVGPPKCEATQRIKDLDWEGLNVQFLYTDPDIAKWKSSAKTSGNWGREMDEGCPEDIARKLNHPKADIMARLDIDDWVAPGWIAHMKNLAKTSSESRFLINYQVIGQAPDGRLYRFYAPHVRSRTSPFIALVQKKDPRISPYEEVHLKMGALFETVYTIPPAYTFMVVHGGNRSNRVYSMDKFLYIKEVTSKQVQTRTMESNQGKKQVKKVAKVTRMSKDKKKPPLTWRQRVGNQDRINFIQTEEFI